MDTLRQRLTERGFNMKTEQVERKKIEIETDYQKAAMYLFAGTIENITTEEDDDVLQTVRVALNALGFDLMELSDMVNKPETAELHRKYAYTMTRDYLKNIQKDV